MVNPIEDANGLVSKYEVYLENKVNGAVKVTLADASEDKTFYYAPGAVVSTGKYLLGTVNASEINSNLELNENGAVTMVKFGGKIASTISFVDTKNVVYDAAAGTLKYYYLQLDNSNTKIKVMVKEGAVEDYLGPGVDELATSKDLSDAKENFIASLGITPVTFNIATPDAFVTTASNLNKISNDAFDLTFTEDISSNAKFANPFTASSLHAVESGNFYFAANYGMTTYNAALKAANKAVSDVKQVKTDAASFVKEMKVAIEDAENATGNGSLKEYAPNKENIELVTPENNMLSTEDDAPDASKKASEAISALAKLGDNIIYRSLADGDPEGTISVMDDSDKAEKALDDALAEVNKTLDEVIKTLETAVNAYNEAVTNSMTSYKPSDVYYNTPVESNKLFWVDFTDFAAYDEDDAAALLNGAAALLDDGTQLTNLKATDIDVTWSDDASVDRSALSGYYPLEVVGEPNTYITVDTVYAAEQEKYLTLNTVKFDKVAVDANNVPLADNVTFDEEKGHKYVIVPSKGHNLIPSLFKVDVDPTKVGNDEIKIYANAPKALNKLPDVESDETTEITAKHFNEYKDDVAYYDLGLDDTDDDGAIEDNILVVIRTLAGAREASVMVPAEDNAVLKNTKITFAEPVLASKISDGDIYFILKKKVSEEETYNKYAVVDPTDEDEVAYAKEAYVNVPATQWYVEKNNDTYELKNRDFSASYDLGAGKIYVVDEDNMIYTTNTRDTFQLVAADVEKEGHVGYKYISEEIQKISEFALSAVNYANMETPYYLTFNGNEDSILTTTSNKEEALALIPMIVDGKQVTEEYKMNDENLTKQYYQLIGKDGKDTLYLKKEPGSNELIVTTVAPKIDLENDIDERIFLQFRSINDEANQYEVLLIQYALNYQTWDYEYRASNKLSYNQDGEAVAVGAGTASAFVYDLVDNSSDIYKNFGFEGSTKVIISLNGDAESKVTKVGPFATVKRTGLNETIDADYSLIMDTAYVDHKDNIRYAYYITKPIVAADTAWNAEKFYMVSYADSLARENDTIKYSQDNLTRIGFVAAKRLGTDSLAITKAVGATAADTLNVTEKLGTTNATFAFAIDENNDEAYRIEVGPNRYVSYLNGILVEGAKEQAQLFNVNATDLTPTDNEEISVEDGVQVIGGKGAVTVQGAAGKTVTVYNFQGRALATTTLTSDNQTIAVPAGLVAVSVEGEPEAISVVVK